jgi:hypothetical protein
MRHVHAAGLVAAAVVTLGAAPARGAQEWSPPSRQMPEMPAASELNGGWRGSLGSWFNGLGVAVAQLRADGDGGGARPRFVRFTAEMRPVETWSDRNGDGKADMIEVYRDGVRTYQLVDADYHGNAHVLRVYDQGGTLLREQHY